MKRPKDSLERKALITAFLSELELPPEGVHARLDRFEYINEKTGQPLGGLLMWSYGDVSAFLTAESFRERCYNVLPPAAQLLVDVDEDLTSAAEYEGKQAQNGDTSG